MSLQGEDDMARPQEEQLPTKSGTRSEVEVPTIPELPSVGRFHSNVLQNLLTELKANEITRREEMARLQAKGRLGEAD